MYSCDIRVRAPSFDVSLAITSRKRGTTDTFTCRLIIFEHTGHLTFSGRTKVVHSAQVAL